MGLLATLIPAAASAVTSLILNNRKRNIKEADQIAGIEYKYGQMGANEAHARQMALYNHQFNNEMMTSNPAFQAERIRAAGFNPALMYQSSQGGLGVSMPQASGGGQVHADRVSPQISTPEALNMLATQAMNYSLLKAQKEQIKAQTENIQADTAVKDVTATGVLPSQIDINKQSLAESLERIQDMQVKRDGQRLENHFMQIRNHIANATSESDILRIRTEALNSIKQLEYTSEEVSRAVRENKIGDATAEALIKKSFEELKNLTVDTELKRVEILAKEENINLSIAQRQNLKDRLELEWETLDIETYIKRRGQDNTIIGTARELIKTFDFGRILFGTDTWESDVLDRAHNQRRPNYSDRRQINGLLLQLSKQK